MNASDKYEYPIEVTKRKTLIGWEFVSEGHDVGFSVALEKEGESRQELIAYSRVDSANV